MACTAAASARVSVSLANKWQSSMHLCACRILISPRARAFAACRAKAGLISSGYFSSIPATEPAARSNAHKHTVRRFCSRKSSERSRRNSELAEKSICLFFSDLRRPHRSAYQTFARSFRKRYEYTARPAPQIIINYNRRVDSLAFRTSGKMYLKEISTVRVLRNKTE